MSPCSLAACVGREEPPEPSPRVCKEKPSISIFWSPLCEAAPAPQHLPQLLSLLCQARGVAECHQLLCPAHSPMPQLTTTAGTHHCCTSFSVTARENRRKEKKRDRNLVLLQRQLFHCTPVNSLRNALGLPTMTSLGDAPGLTHCMTCHVFPMWQKLLLRHSLGQLRWSMGPGLQVLGTPKIRETPKMFCVVLRAMKGTSWRIWPCCLIFPELKQP